MPLKPGTMLGPYEVLSLIGAGGMGEVYKGRDTRLNRDVALKVLPAHLAERTDLRERFQREAETIANLKHPHICVLYDIGKQDGPTVEGFGPQGVLHFLERLDRHLGQRPLEEALQQQKLQTSNNLPAPKAQNRLPSR